MSYQIDIKPLSAVSTQSSNTAICVTAGPDIGADISDIAESIESVPGLSPADLLPDIVNSYNVLPSDEEEKYRSQLQRNPERLFPLMRLARSGAVVLVYQGDIQPDYLSILRQELLDQLRQEDEADREPASPTCYLNEGDL